MATIRKSSSRKDQKEQTLTVGDVFIRSDTQMPGGLQFEFEEYGRWKKLVRVDCHSVEALAPRVGWSFSYIAPQQVSGKAFGLGLQSAANSALNEVLRAAGRTNFNALEITHLIKHRVVGTHYIHIVAHPRQLRPNPYLRNPDPYYFPNRAQDLEPIFRRAAEIQKQFTGI
jgi:hypothetical protein